MKAVTPELARWSTDEVALPQRVEYYAAALESSVDPMFITKVGKGPFSAQITSAPLGPISAVRVVGDAHSLKRGSKELARSGGEPHFRLIVNLSCAWQLQHHGAVSLRPRDVVLIDSRYSHATEIPGSFDVLHLKLPKQWVERWIPRAAQIAGQPIRFDQSWGNALSSFIAQMSPEFAIQSPLPAGLVADHLGVLLSLASGHLSPGSVPLPERTLAVRIRECTTQRCPELLLTASDVASTLGISVRTLHRSLAACNLSFAVLLIDARATQALRLLESPMFAAVNVAEIGRRSGFSDASHFTRVMRRRTGFSPRQIQQGQNGS